MIVQSKTNTITMTTQDLYAAIRGYLILLDVEGYFGNVLNITINQSGVISSNATGTTLLDENTIIATITIPLP